MPNVDCRKILAKPYSLPELKQGEIFLTARSLFLNENLTCHAYNYPALAWNHGSYSTTLCLTPQVLRSWQDKRILDIGGGASVFPEEARRLLNASVTALDINRQTVFQMLDRQLRTRDMITQRVLPEAVGADSIESRRLIELLYVKNLEWLYCTHGDKAAGFEDLFNQLVDSREQIAQTFYRDPAQHKQGDATQTDNFRRNEFDVVISVWVLNYLGDDQKRKALQNAFYWSKPKSQIRINAGTDSATGSQKGTLDEAMLKRLFDKHVITEGTWWKSWYISYEGKRITLNRESGNGVLILDCEPAP